VPRLKKAADKKARTRSHRRTVGLRSSSNFVDPVKELLMVRISGEIEERQWTQMQAAKVLGVSQPRISNLMRGLTDNFTLDTLVQWMGVLGLKLKIDTESGAGQKSMSAWLDDSENAIPYYTRLLSFNPADAESHWKRAYAYHQRGQYDLAVGDYARAMELDASLQYLRINRAQSFICLGQFGAAFLDCDKLIAQSKDASFLSWSYITRASAHQAQGNFDAALDEYAKAIESNPTSASPYFQRGCLHQQLKKWKRAREDFSKVIEIEPENISAQQHLQQVSKQRGDKTDDE